MHWRTRRCRLIPRARPSRRRAFNLFELVLVLAIITVVSAIAVPRYAGALVRYRVDAAARRVVADLDMARVEARNSSRSVTVNFELPPANRLWMPGVAGLNDPNVDYSVTLSDEPYHATLVSANFSGSPTLSFDGFGRPGSGGAVVVQVGDVQKTITVNPDTGQASVQ